MPVLFQMSSIPQLLSNLQNLGFFQFVLPFLLALAIFYGVLSYSLEKQLPKSARGLVSLVLALFVMLYAASNPQIVSFLSFLAGSGLSVAVGIIFLVIFLGLFGLHPFSIMTKEHNIGAIGWVIVFAVILIAISLFSGSIGGLLNFVPGISSDLLTIIIFIAILGLALWWLGRGEGEHKEGNGAAGGKPQRG